MRNCFENLLVFCFAKGEESGFKTLCQKGYKTTNLQAELL